MAAEQGIKIYKASDYGLKDTESHVFFQNNTFGIGISMGWQRLIPGMVLEKFIYGIFGFHGSCGYLPFGRGRSPLNWSIALGDTRFILNMFRYDEKADSPNVFRKIMFEINPFDTIRTLQYKNIMAAKKMIGDLLLSYMSGKIVIQSDSCDFDSWYNKRTSADGRLNFHDRTRNLYNLIRAVAHPFPGAFTYYNKIEVKIWRAYPFEQIMDFSQYAPGQIIDIIDGNLIIRTLDGSLLVTEYETEAELKALDVFDDI